MSDHADTIREALALPSGHNYASTIARSVMQDEARGALDALLAENQQLWELVGCAEAHFAAENDDEASMAESEFDRLREALAGDAE